MLKEEQVNELLLRCEKIFGHKLLQVRGNLRNAVSRSAAIWELLVIEAASYLGSIEYEPFPGGSPDIRLSVPQGRALWIEVAYLYPRFWKEERQSYAVTGWLYKEARRRNIPAWKIFPEFDGDPNNKAGPVCRLPDLNERKKFLKNADLVKFFEGITINPGIGHRCSLSDYTVVVSFLPNAQGPFLSSRGLVQESPRRLKEHAVYRVLKNKADQHNVLGPRVICLGSDQSPVLTSSPVSNYGQLRVSDVIAEAFRECKNLSAAIVVSIQNSYSGFSKFRKQARGQIFLNPYARDPLTNEESQLLSKINLNRWKYTFALQKWEYPNDESHRRISGSLTYKQGGLGVELEVPANIVIDALAGKTNLFKEYQLSQNDSVHRALEEGWLIKTCKLKEGDIEAGEAPKVVFGLVPPFLSIFGPKKKENNSV
jgi:hypothetical protein